MHKTLYEFAGHCLHPISVLDGPMLLQCCGCFRIRPYWLDFRGGTVWPFDIEDTTLLRLGLR